MKKFKPQYARLLFIDSLIRGGHYPNCASISREYEVSQRTITRDIEYMRYTLNAPIEYDNKNHGYYYTEEQYMLPAIPISESDLFSLCIAEKALEQYQSTPLYDSLSSIMGKLGAMLTDEVHFKISLLGTRFSFIPESRTMIDPKVWESAATSLRSGIKLEIDYHKATGEASVRTVRPYHIASYGGEWYIIAYCERRKEIVRFALSRIDRAKLTGETYEIAEDFNFHAFIGESFGIMNEGEEFTVKILFSGAQAPYITERTWHASQVLEEKDDGSVVLTFPATSIYEVKRWVLSWGADAKVQQPIELVEEIIKEAGRLKDIYFSGGKQKA